MILNPNVSDCCVTVSSSIYRLIGELLSGCIELVARDLKDLFTAYFEKLQWLLAEEESGQNTELFAEWKAEEVEAVLEHFKSFFDDRVDAVHKYLDDSNSLLKEYGLSVVPSALNVPRSIAGSRDGSTPSHRHFIPPHRIIKSDSSSPTEADDDLRAVTESDDDLEFGYEDRESDEGDSQVPTVSDEFEDYDDT
jgi:hypothetical protein